MLCTVQKNIRKLASPLREGDWPHLGCSVCGEGGLAFDRVDWEHEDNRKTREEDPRDVQGRFVLRMVCGRAPCASWVLFTGDYTMDWYDDGAYLDLWEVLTVRTILPPIPILDFSDDVPESVRSAALRARPCFGSTLSPSQARCGPPSNTSWTSRASS
jgi:hypothetical protein